MINISLLRSEADKAVVHLHPLTRLSLAQLRLFMDGWTRGDFNMDELDMLTDMVDMRLKVLDEGE